MCDTLYYVVDVGRERRESLFHSRAACVCMCVYVYDVMSVLPICMYIAYRTWLLSVTACLIVSCSCTGSVSQIGFFFFFIIVRVKYASSAGVVKSSRPSVCLSVSVRSLAVIRSQVTHSITLHYPSYVVEWLFQRWMASSTHWLIIIIHRGDE